MALKSASEKYAGVWINELKNGDTVYYINYRDENGQPVKKKVGKKTKQSNFTIKDAYDKLIEVKHKLSTGETLEKETPRKKRQTLNDLYNNYIKWAENNKKSWKEDKWLYGKHLETSLGLMSIKTIKPLDIEEFKHEKINEDYAAQTIKHMLQLVRRIFNYAIKYELIKNIENPISKIEMPKIDNKRIRFLSQDEARNFLELLKELDNNRTYQLTMFSLFTGARFGEVTSLTWNDIDFKQNTIYFKKTKDGNSRYIAIAEPLKEVIRELDQTTQFVLSNNMNKQITKVPDDFMKCIEVVCPGNKEKSAQYKITFHSLRHTHASWLAQGGLDILNIKEQLGHKTLEMTLRYAHLIPNKRFEATVNLMQEL